jgi:hypothetical protein
VAAPPLTRGAGEVTASTAAGAKAATGAHGRGSGKGVVSAEERRSLLSLLALADLVSWWLALGSNLLLGDEKRERRGLGCVLLCLVRRHSGRQPSSAAFWMRALPPAFPDI